ncbi:MAG: hypothetical protein V5A55_15225 [Halovenus sp.]
MSDVAGSVGTVVVGLGVAADVSLGTAGTAAVLVVFAIPEGDLLEVGLWLAAGCGVLGITGWVVATLFFSNIPAAAGLGAGIAVGGGLGAVMRLLVFGQEESQAETVTVDMDDGKTPGPRPADLFEASPDPLLYYTSGEGPVVRAGNRAFEETFDVGDNALDGTSLPEALMTADSDDIVRAATAGETFDAVRRCETVGGERDLRIRVVPVGDGTHGYVMYTEPTRSG